MRVPTLLFGMAMQAFCNSFLLSKGLLKELTADQQLGASILFVSASGVIFVLQVIYDRINRNPH